MIGEIERFNRLAERQGDMLGNVDRSYTATLRVSPDGTGADGLSWRTAYTTLNAALDASSADANDITLIRMAPGTYDILQPGQPTWTNNVVIQGTHRNFSTITNTHATASCVLRLEGMAVVQDLCIANIAADNGLLLMGNGARASRLCFDSSGLTGVAVSLWLDGIASRAIDCEFSGSLSYATAINVMGAHCLYEKIAISNCARGLWIHDNAADGNIFSFIDIGETFLAVDIDSGNDQFFHEVNFHHNNRNVDDEVGDSVWVNIHGEAPVYLHPDNFTGDLVSTDGAGDTWGADTAIIATGAIDNPFRVVAIHAEGSANEKFRIKFSADGGAAYYDDIMIEGSIAAVSREASTFPSQSVPVYNAGTRISARAKSESGGNSVWVWVEIQEI